MTVRLGTETLAKLRQSAREQGMDAETTLWIVVVAEEISPDHGRGMKALGDVNRYVTSAGGFLGSYYAGKQGNGLGVGARCPTGIRAGADPGSGTFRHPV